MKLLVHRFYKEAQFFQFTVVVCMYVWLCLTSSHTKHVKQQGHYT